MAQPVLLGPITHPTRPILAIDTAPPPIVHRHPPLPITHPHREVIAGEPLPSIARHPLDQLSSASPAKLSATPSMLSIKFN